jgi:hypothetical protein
LTFAGRFHFGLMSGTENHASTGISAKDHCAKISAAQNGTA